MPTRSSIKYQTNQKLSSESQTAKASLQHLLTLNAHENNGTGHIDLHMITLVENVHFQTPAITKTLFTMQGDALSSFIHPENIARKCLDIHLRPFDRMKKLLANIHDSQE